MYNWDRFNNYYLFQMWLLHVRMEHTLLGIPLISLPKYGKTFRFTKYERLTIPNGQSN